MTIYKQKLLSDVINQTKIQLDKSIFFSMIFLNWWQNNHSTDQEYFPNIFLTQKNENDGQIKFKIHTLIVWSGVSGFLPKRISP